VDEALRAYFAAWNEPDADTRARLLGDSVTEAAELIDPTGHWRGIDGLMERIGRYHAAALAPELLRRVESTRTTTSPATPGESPIRRASTLSTASISQSERATVG
jgi:hypothetical protein